MFKEKIMALFNKKPYSREAYDNLDENQKSLKNVYESVINKGSGVDEGPWQEGYVKAKIQERRKIQTEMRTMKTKAHEEALRINDEIDRKKLAEVRNNIEKL